MTSAAVPVKKTSSATYSNSRGINDSTTSKPSSRAIVTTLARVMPARIDAPSGGVMILPSRTTNTFSPEPSLTYPLTSSAIPSAYPSAAASWRIRIEFM